MIDFHAFSVGFLKKLGYSSSRRLPAENLTMDDLNDSFGFAREFDPKKLLVADWRSFFLLFQLTNTDFFPEPTSRLTEHADSWNSYLFFALELSGGRGGYSKSQLEAIAVGLNRAFLIPVFLLIKHGNVISLVITSRRASRRDPGSDVIERVFSIIALDLQHPVKRDREILEKISLDYIKRAHHVLSLAQLHEYWATFFDAVPVEKIEVERERNELDLVKIYFADLANYPMPTEEEKLYDALTANPLIAAMPPRERQLWKQSSLPEFYQHLVGQIHSAMAEVNEQLRAAAHLRFSEWVDSIQALKDTQGIVGDALRGVHDHFYQLAADDLYVAMLRLVSCIYLLPREIAALLPDELTANTLMEKIVADSDLMMREFNRVNQISARSRVNLVNSNLRLVISRARKKMIPGEDILDLIQVGSTGLMRAAELFDITKKAQFTTYATIWIDQRISRHLADHSRLIRLPVHTHTDVLKMYRVKNQMLLENGCDPSLLELALALDLLPADLKDELMDTDFNCHLLSRHGEKLLKTSLQKLQHLMLISLPVLSLERRVGRGDMTLGEVIPDDSHQKMIHDLDCALLRCALEEKPQPLGERGIRILKLRYGYLENHEYTLEEIAQDQGVTRERIRQIETQCLFKLKRSCRELATMQ